ncbi:MAG: hypothetical protein IJN58_09320 [Clostridia bacterium]|nr:hypothetical protein [Clostridia bacterium]
MNRYARKKEQYVPKLEKIELSQKNIKLRWVAAIAFFAVGAASLAFALNSYLTPETGWEQIAINGDYGETCADEFLLMYHLGSGEESPSTEKKAVTNIYTDSCEEAYKIFHSETEYDGVGNLAAINAGPNQEVTVDPALYAVLEKLDNHGIRTHYLGPAYEIYNGIFGCTEDYQTADYDPLQNPGLKTTFSEIAGYAMAEETIDLEFLGDHRVRLTVSDDYLRYANTLETNRFLDLSWMKNAFIADYLADALIDGGYTHGVITSYDGYTRNLETQEEIFYHQLYDVKPLAQMEYRGPMSLVELRAYPVNAMDRMRYYTLETGAVRVPYLDVADGLPKAAAGSLVAYSEEVGCGDLLCQILPTYVGDSFDEERLADLAKSGIYGVYPQNGTICHTADAVTITDESIETKHIK